MMLHSPLIVIATEALRLTLKQLPLGAVAGVRLVSSNGHQLVRVGVGGAVYEPLPASAVDDMLLLFENTGSYAAVFDALRKRMAGFIARLEQEEADDAFRVACFGAAA